jgi:hypothetical protein
MVVPFDCLEANVADTQDDVYRHDGGGGPDGDTRAT